MSRRAKLTRAVAAGYGLMAVTVIYTLTSVPLALKYLEKSEFGLWALVAQIGGYWALIDLGMSGSILRTLIDHKDERHLETYGTVIKTGLVVGVAQGAIVMILGSLSAPLLASAFHIPGELRPVFIRLLIGQSICFGIFHPCGIFTHILGAHQRYDLASISQLSSLVVSLFTLWYCFHRGLGIYSLLWALGIGSTVSAGTGLGTCIILGLLPGEGAWGAFDPRVFKELFRFGADLFFQHVGWQLVTASQVIMISRFISLEAAATYVVCTKTFSLAQQVVGRLFDFSVPAFSEMVARNEHNKLNARFKDLLLLTAGLSVLIGIITAACNQSFISLWTHSKVSWNPLNDWLMAGLTIAYSINRIHGGMAWVMKKARDTRSIYFLEGVAFVLLALPVVHYLGIPGILLTSLLSDCAITGVFGFRLTARSLGMQVSQLVRSALMRPAILLLLFLPLSLIVWTTNLQWNAFFQMGINAATLSVLGLLLFQVVALTPNLRLELTGALMARFARFSQR
jgi:O-antigen/teichoic acid export membrane protein